MLPQFQLLVRYDTARSAAFALKVVGLIKGAHAKSSGLARQRLVKGHTDNDGARAHRLKLLGQLRNWPLTSRLGILD